MKQGVITQDEYISLKSGYGQKTATLTGQIALLQEERQNLEQVERIDVHEGRRLTIYFKF